MVTGVLVGVLGLAEALPHTAGAAAVRLVSWACILLGVSGGPAALCAPREPAQRGNSVPRVRAASQGCSVQLC